MSSRTRSDEGVRFTSGPRDSALAYDGGGGLASRTGPGAFAGHVPGTAMALRLTALVSIFLSARCLRTSTKMTAPRTAAATTTTTATAMRIESASGGLSPSSPVERADDRTVAGIVAGIVGEAYFEAQFATPWPIRHPSR